MVANSVKLNKREMPMKRNTMTYFLLFAFICCSSQGDLLRDQNFNDKARRFFRQNFDSLDFEPFSESEKCVIKNTIESDLDQLNDWQILTIKDDFTVRSYIETSIPLRFSLAKEHSSDRYYMLGLPHLEKLIWDVEKYYRREKNDSMYVLLDFVRPIRLTSSMFDDFFRNQVFKIDVGDKRSFYQGILFIDHFLEETYKFMPFSRIDVNRFKEEMKALGAAGVLQASSERELEDLIDRKFLDNFYDVKCFRMNEIGYLTLCYSVDREYSTIKVDFYFIPEFSRRYLAGRSITEHVECYGSGRK